MKNHEASSKSRICQIQLVLERAVRDEIFKKRIEEEPESTLEEYNLSLEVVERIKQLSKTDFELLTQERMEGTFQRQTGVYQPKQEKNLQFEYFEDEE